MEPNKKNVIIQREVTMFRSCDFENELSLSIRLDAFCILDASCTANGKCLIALCGECMVTLSLPFSGACNLAILNCAPVFAPRLLRCACGLVMQYCKVFF